jgi:ribosomal protein L28
MRVLYRHKVFRMIHKVRRRFQSKVLEQEIPIIVSKKAERTINKMGSFDTYILCTPPKNLDSKYGEYLR